MLGKKIVSIKKLEKKVKVVGRVDSDPAHLKLLKEYKEEEKIPTTKKVGSKKSGVFALYVGEERQRYVVPTRYLSHPLFKMLLEKAYNEFGFEQRNGLVVPCECSNNGGGFVNDGDGETAMKGMEKSYGVVIEERAATGTGGGGAVVVGGDERRVKKKIEM